MDRTCIETESEQKNSGHKWMAKVHDDKKGRTQWCPWSACNGYV